MEQALKQRLIGAVILISLAVIFVPMFFGQKPTDSGVIAIEIPEAPKDLDYRILALPEQELEVLAKVSVSENDGVKVTNVTIPEPPKIKPIEGITAWVVQVGSFSDEKMTNILSDKLRKAGFTAFVEQSAVKEAEIYRVRIGPELNKKKAEVIRMKLQKEQMLANAIVVQYP
jgi:Uncharacterized protein conserved in bacteria